MTLLDVEVTAEDIAKGVKEDCGACPVALALRRAGLGRAMVDGTSISWSFGVSGGGDVECPCHVAEFIESFDEGDDVEPFSFQLTLEGEV